ncbi:protein FAM8A1-like [Styela clava]
MENSKEDNCLRQKKVSEIHNEYMKRLHEWQRMSNFHYFMCLNYQGMQMMHARNHATPSTATVTTTTAPPTSNVPRPTRQQHSAPRPRFEFRVAPIIYRVGAELIDFTILMLLKMIFLLGIMKITGKSVENVSYQFILGDDLSIIDDMTIEDLQHMMLMGFIYRILACFYEAGFISIVGATPGKMVFGLEVVFCQACVSVERGNRRFVSVYPGHTPSIGSSTVRSVIKNFSITFLMPAFLTVFFYQHNRTSYDLVASTLVVRSNT